MEDERAKKIYKLFDIIVIKDSYGFKEFILYKNRKELEIANIGKGDFYKVGEAILSRHHSYSGFANNLVSSIEKNMDDKSIDSEHESLEADVSIIDSQERSFSNYLVRYYKKMINRALSDEVFTVNRSIACEGDALLKEPFICLYAKHLMDNRTHDNEQVRQLLLHTYWHYEDFWERHQPQNTGLYPISQFMVLFSPSDESIENALKKTTSMLKTEGVIDNIKEEFKKSLGYYLELYSKKDLEKTFPSLFLHLKLQREAFESAFEKVSDFIDVSSLEAIGEVFKNRFKEELENYQKKHGIDLLPLCMSDRDDILLKLVGRYLSLDNTPGNSKHLRKAKVYLEEASKRKNKDRSAITRKLEVVRDRLEAHSKIGNANKQSTLNGISIDVDSKAKIEKRPRISNRDSNESIEESPKKKFKQADSSEQSAGEAESDGFQRQDKDLETLQEKRFDVLQNKGSVSNNSLLDEEGNIIENSNLDFQKDDLSDSNEVGKESNLDDSQQSDMELGVNGDESHVSGAKILVTDGGEDHEKERYSQESSSEESDSRSSSSDFQESEQYASSDSGDESISEKKAKLVREIGEHLDHNGGTILHVLARLADSGGIRSLVRQGADINAVDEKGFTPFHYGVISASSCAFIGFFEELLYCHANPKIKASDGRDVYDILKDRGCSMDRIENIVSCVGDEDYNSMVDEDYNSIVDLLTSYYSYTFNFNDEIAHHILLPIHVAAKMCDAKDLEFLIGIVNNVNDKSFKYNKEAPIHFALSNSSEPESAEEKIKVLIKAGADVNIRSEPLGFAPLHHAVRYSSLGAVEILIKAGANVNDAENYVRFTPLHYAAAEDRKEIAQLLIQNGANVNAGDNDRYIPLHLAAEKGHDKVAGLLLERGATVNATMSDGCTPLHLAAQCGHSEVVDLLLADPNINVGCIDFKFVSKENADKRKLVQKKVQDGRLFEKVKEAAEKMKNGGELGESLKEELENLLKPESEYGFEPGLNHSPDDSDENTTINIAIRAGGELLQLLYDYAEKNIGVDSEIFERLKYAKENPPPRSSLNDVSIPHNLAQAQALIT